MSNRQSPMPGIPADYLKQDSWTNIAQKAHGDNRPERIYLAVGKALTQWELWETELAGLFGILVDGRTKAAVRAYGLLSSTAGRHDALREAALVFFDTNEDKMGYHAAFADIVKIYSYARSARNNIAHGACADLNHEGNFLMPPLHASKKITAKIKIDRVGVREMLEVKFAYTASQIIYFSERFTNMGRYTNMYLSMLWKAYCEQKLLKDRPRLL